MSSSNALSDLSGSRVVIPGDIGRVDALALFQAAQLDLTVTGSAGPQL